MNWNRQVLLASCLALAGANLAPERAPAQVTLTPRIIQIDQLKCAELQTTPEQTRDRLLVYFNGYMDGMRRHTVWDERKVGELVERAVNYCKADPNETLLSAFTRASR